MAIKAPTFEEIGAPPSFESIGAESIDITTILDPAEEERQIKETLDLSEQYSIPINDSQKFVAVPEPGLFRSMLNKVKESIRERTGYFEPPIYGPKFREEQPFRTAGKMAAFYGAEAVSGLSLTALDVLTNKTVGDKTLADAVARITGFEPTSKEIGAGESVKYIAAFTPAGKIVRAGTKLIPAAQTLKTILSSGLTFATTDAAIQFSKNITEGKPVDWSHVHAAGGVGVLWGTGEVAVAAVLSKIVKGMDKYWGEKGMDVAEKLRPPGTSLKDQYARQQAEIRTDINRAKEVFRKTGKMPEDLMKKYVHGKPPEGSVFKPPEAVPVKKPVQAPITKVKKAVPVPEPPAKAITKAEPTIIKAEAVDALSEWVRFNREIDDTLKEMQRVSGQARETLRDKLKSLQVERDALDLGHKVREMTPEEIVEDEEFHAIAQDILNAGPDKANAALDILEQRIGLLTKVSEGILTQEEADIITAKFVAAAKLRIPEPQRKQVISREVAKPEPTITPVEGEVIDFAKEAGKLRPVGVKGIKAEKPTFEVGDEIFLKNNREFGPVVVEKIELIEADPETGLEESYLIKTRQDGKEIFGRIDQFEPITPVEAKQPWEMTREEYREQRLAEEPDLDTKIIDEEHWEDVMNRVVEQEKPVPRAVLEEYKSEKWAQEALAKAGVEGEVEGKKKKQYEIGDNVSGTYLLGQKIKGKIKERHFSTIPGDNEIVYTVTLDKPMKIEGSMRESVNVTLDATTGIGDEQSLFLTPPAKAGGEVEAIYDTLHPLITEIYEKVEPQLVNKIMESKPALRAWIDGEYTGNLSIVEKEGRKAIAELQALTPAPPAKAEGKLPGGRQAGGTTFIPDIAAELQTIGHKLIHNPVELTKATVEMAKRNMKSAINHMRTLGPAGEKLADEIERITFDVTKKTGNDLADIRNIFKGVTKPDREVIAKLVNGRTDPEAQPEKLIKKAKQLRDVLDRTMIEANELGMERRVQGKKIPVGGKGKAFPQVPNEKGQKFLEEASAKGKSSAAVFAWAQTQVSAGKYETVDKAIAALQAFRAAQFRGINRYLETERIELPVEMIEWDGTRTLPSLVERNWMTIEGVRKWGINFGLVKSRVEQIKGEYGVDEAMRVKTYIETSFGIKSPASRQAQVISNKIRGYQFIVKVGTSPLTISRNMFDRIAKGFTISPISTIKTFWEYPPFINQFIESSQKLEEHMIRSGVVFGHGSISEGYEAGSVITELASAPFSSSERGNQVFIAQVQYHKLLDDISKLKGREEVTNRLYEVIKGVFGQSTEQIRMRVEKPGGGALVDKLLKGEQITADEMNYILHQAVRDKAYPMILSTKPIWYDSHPMMKVLAQFKTWPVRQTNMIWQDVVKYTVKSKDPSRLIGFLVGTLIAGELYNIMRDFLFDKKESILSQYFKDPTQRELGRAIINDLFDGGVVGVFADLSYGIKDWVTGVSARSAKNVWETIGHIKKAPMLTPQALERLMIQEITPYRQVKKLAEKVDRAWINKNNISSQHYKWRSLGWEWKEQKKNPSVTDKVQAWTDKVMFGFEDYGIGEDTLAYELTSRQIVAGDVDDATKYLIYILNRADDKKAKQAAIKQSMKNRSPLGKIAEKDRTEFLSQFSPTERVEAMKVQAKYLSMYNRALAMAIGKMK